MNKRQIRDNIGPKKCGVICMKRKSFALALSAPPIIFAALAVTSAFAQTLDETQKWLTKHMVAEGGGSRATTVATEESGNVRSASGDVRYVSWLTTAIAFDGCDFTISWSSSTWSDIRPFDRDHPIFLTQHCSASADTAVSQKSWTFFNPQKNFDGSKWDYENQTPLYGVAVCNADCRPQSPYSWSVGGGVEDRCTNGVMVPTRDDDTARRVSEAWEHFVALCKHKPELFK
jgi:hypothetical protein